MPKVITVAVTQMDPAPAPLAERLGRAERLVAAAAAQGAALLALPELFNTGYIYDERNYALAEPPDGPTVTWLRQMASRYALHLGGALLLRDGDEIYDSLLLAAPDGQTWRYDKRYPWAWERAYFRPGGGVSVAETALGRIGLLICWDVAHRELWQAYAGQVDLMLVSSCPPDVSQPVYTFPDGSRVTLEQAGKRMAAITGSGALTFGQMLDEQAAWLGVPLLNAMGAGRFSSPVPRPAALILSLLPQNPRLLRCLFARRGRAKTSAFPPPPAPPPRGRGDIGEIGCSGGLRPPEHPISPSLPPFPAGRGARGDGEVRRTPEWGVHLDCPMAPGCKIVDAQGRALAQIGPEAGEAVILAEVTLRDAPPQPSSPQPPSPLPPIAYDLSDRLLPRLMLPLYRKGQRLGHRPPPTGQR